MSLAVDTVAAASPTRHPIRIGMELNIVIQCNRIHIALRARNLERAIKLLNEAMKLATLLKDDAMTQLVTFWEGMVEAAGGHKEEACRALFRAAGIVGRLPYETQVWIAYLEREWAVASVVIEAMFEHSIDGEAAKTVIWDLLKSYNDAEKRGTLPPQPWSPGWKLPNVTKDTEEENTKRLSHERWLKELEGGPKTNSSQEVILGENVLKTQANHDQPINKHQNAGESVATSISLAVEIPQDTLGLVWSQPDLPQDSTISKTKAQNSEVVDQKPVDSYPTTDNVVHSPSAESHTRIIDTKRRVSSRQYTGSRSPLELPTSRVLSWLEHTPDEEMLRPVTTRSASSQYSYSTRPASNHTKHNSVHGRSASQGTISYGLSSGINTRNYQSRHGPGSIKQPEGSEELVITNSSSSGGVALSKNTLPSKESTSMNSNDNSSDQGNMLSRISTPQDTIVHNAQSFPKGGLNHTVQPKQMRNVDTNSETETMNDGSTSVTDSFFERLLKDVRRPVEATSDEGSRFDEKSGESAETDPSKEPKLKDANSNKDRPQSQGLIDSLMITLRNTESRRNGHAVVTRSILHTQPERLDNKTSDINHDNAVVEDIALSDTPLPEQPGKAENRFVTKLQTSPTYFNTDGKALYQQSGSWRGSLEPTSPSSPLQRVFMADP